MKESSRNPDFQENLKAEAWSRRKLLKALTAAGGAVTAATLLPGKWVKPIIEVGLLPAHAQTSPVPNPVPPPACSITTGTFNVVMTWNTDANLDLHVYEPCSGIDVAPVGFGGPLGDTIQHLGDNTDGSGPETVSQTTPGEIFVGTYEIHPGHISGALPTTATMTIKTDIGDTIVQVTFNSTGYLFGLADVTFPGGQVTRSSAPAAPGDHN